MMGGAERWFNGKIACDLVNMMFGGRKISHNDVLF